MLEWIKSHKLLTMAFIILIFLIFIIFMPIILNKIYYTKAPCYFFAVEYDISSILDYYGSILTFIGTTCLGIVTIYQNYISQKKTDEVNKLTLELQKKSMAMAEQNYEKIKINESSKNVPKFELVCTGFNGFYSNLSAALRNVSDIFVSGIKSVSFEVFNEFNEIIITSDKVISKEYSLSPGQSTKLEFNNTEIRSDDKYNIVYGMKVFESLKRITMVWAFKCDDSYGNTRYYKATKYIEDSSKLDRTLWEIVQVG